MKFVCLGYYNETQWNQLSAAEQATLMDNCFAYDDELRRGGHILGGEALQSIQNTATLRYQNGQVVVTDGPFTETKEQIGGLLMLEARDLNHAIQLMSLHPGVRNGPFEIRPVDEAINAQFEARNQSFQHR
ncbi:MAG: YciI family protein [Phormidesmis sp. RL_2_1]|nr:YciI family protein [Phormidesmis sp. RL_2_1]